MSKDTREWMVLFVIIAVIAMVIVGPLVTIWALNMIFHLSIPRTFETWFAVAWLAVLVHGVSK